MTEPTLTPEVAAAVLRGYAPAGTSLPEAFRLARIATHPDRHNGSTRAWDRAAAAATVLGLL